MAIEKMTKVSMVCLKTEEESLRSFLRDRGVLHISDMKQSLINKGEDQKDNEQRNRHDEHQPFGGPDLVLVVSCESITDTCRQ